jgi:hypothetical protein
MKTVEVTISAVSRSLLERAFVLSMLSPSVYGWRKGDSFEERKSWQDEIGQVFKFLDDLDGCYCNEWRRELEAVGEARAGPFVYHCSDYASAHAASIELARELAEALQAAWHAVMTCSLPRGCRVLDFDDLPPLSFDDRQALHREIDLEEARLLQNVSTSHLASKNAPMPYKITSSMPLAGAVATERAGSGWTRYDTLGRWAKALSMSPRTLVRRIKEGKIRAESLSSKMYRIGIEHLPAGFFGKQLPAKT